MENIYLNYQELAFIMDLPTSDAKELFRKKLNKEKPLIKDEIKVLDLKDFFVGIKSLDSRYDGQNELLFYLEHKKQLYKRYLNEKTVIKKKRFGGGKTIFYKILPKLDLEFIKNNLEEKHKYLYGKK